MNKITILIPVYNEVNTLMPILQKLESIDFYGLEKEIIWRVNQDGSWACLENNACRKGMGIDTSALRRKKFRGVAQLVERLLW